MGAEIGCTDCTETSSEAPQRSSHRAYYYRLSHDIPHYRVLFSENYLEISKLAADIPPFIPVDYMSFAGAVKSRAIGRLEQSESFAPKMRAGFSKKSRPLITLAINSN
jgi:hypothetical protein